MGLKGIVIDAPSDEVTDELIMVALTLALYPSALKHPSMSASEFTLLSNFQLVPQLADVAIPDAHVHALRHLVNAKGGFDSLESLELKQGLSLFDLLTTSKYLTRPFWPLPSNLERNQVTELLADTEQGCLPVSELHPCIDAVLPNSLSWEFMAVRGYNRLLMDHTQGLAPRVGAECVLDLRNMIHYHVMSLPPTDEILNYQSLPPIYGSLRLGLIAYSLRVLFPIPLATEPHPRLSHLLRYELELTQMNLDIWMPVIELLLWVAMLGGMAAHGTEHRSWYVDQIQWLTGVMGIESWGQLKGVLTSIIWFERCCDVDAFALWLEVHTCRQLILDGDPEPFPTFEDPFY
ncbi:hypothetical protein BJX99DRAFT_260969 [Aspergillus californicus]